MHPSADANAAAGTTTAFADLACHYGELELPAFGIWPLVPTSHVAIAASHHDHPIRRRVIDGDLDIGHLPELSTLRIELGGPEAMTFTGQPTAVTANRYGGSEWSIAGVLTHAGHAELMELRLSYHGVFRSQGRASAWFSGSGSVETPTKTRWRRRARNIERRLVTLDLLFDSPVSPKSPSLVPRVA